MQKFDVIVVGLGAMGASTVYHLAARGVRVLGIDRFGIAHDRGSSHGETRIIRKSYFEHDGYVPLVERALQKWAELEAISGSKLMERTGLLMAGYGGGELIPGVRQAASTHKLPIEELEPADVSARFPGLRCRDGLQVLFEPDAGFLRPEDCIGAYISQAMKNHASFTFGTPVTLWEKQGTGFSVQTSAETYLADKLVMCGGAWTAQLLPEWSACIEVRRKPVLWYRATEPSYRLDHGFPVFAFETEDAFFYGFPSLDGQTVKVGEHTGGDRVSDAGKVVRELQQGDTERVDRFVAEFLPQVDAQVVRHGVCMYSMSPDNQFIVGMHPRHHHVLVACGFSGHGFKFAPVVGEALAELACTGKTQRLPPFISPARSSIRTPSQGE